MSRQTQLAPLLKKDDKLGEGVNLQRWAVVQKIGDGGFAEVYEVKDGFRDNAKFAVKIDKLDKRKDLRGSTVKAEHKVLKQLQGCPHVCRLVEDGYGTFHGRNFIVMERLGMNLTQYQFQQPHKRLTALTARRIGLEMLDALEEIHRAGWIHRDVKPANFVELVIPGTASAWRIIDFGIARRYLTEEGQLIPKRDAFGEFRGSTTYASINAHLKQDLGRRDDLWSWLYILVEMLEGRLPWRMSGSKSGGSETSAETDPRSAAMRLKQRCLEDPHQLSVSGRLPESLVNISRYLQSLSFEAEPNYDKLRQCLEMLPFSITREQPAAAPSPQHSMRAPPPHNHVPAARGNMQGLGQAQWNGWQQAGHPAAVAAAGMNGGMPPAMPPGQGRVHPPQLPHLGPPVMAPLPPNPAGSMQPSAQHNAAYGWQPIGAPVAYSHMQQPHQYSYGQARGMDAAGAAQAALQHQELMRQEYARAMAEEGHWGSADGHLVQGQSAQHHQDTQPSSSVYSCGLSAHSSIDELGHLGSAFDDEEQIFSYAEEGLSATAPRIQSHARAGKRRADSEPELPDVKRRLVQHPLMAAPAATTPSGVHANGVSRQSSRIMRGLADRVTQGKLSPEGSKVKETLKKMKPVEGMSIMAWLIEALATNVEAKGAPQVSEWLGCLAEFSLECSRKVVDRCMTQGKLT